MTGVLAPSVSSRLGGLASTRSGMLDVVDDAEVHPGVHIAPLGELLVATAAGDRDAFSRFYDHMAARVHGLVRRVLVDAAQAEEVTQDVFLEVWQTAARLDPARGTAVAWVLTLAHRRAVDRVRSSQASRERDLKIGIRDVEVAVDDVAEAAELAIAQVRRSPGSAPPSGSASPWRITAGARNPRSPHGWGSPSARSRLGCAMA